VFLSGRLSRAALPRDRGEIFSIAENHVFWGWARGLVEFNEDQFRGSEQSVEKRDLLFFEITENTLHNPHYPNQRNLWIIATKS